MLTHVKILSQVKCLQPFESSCVQQRRFLNYSCNSVGLACKVNPLMMVVAITETCRNID